jgi:hypothetical protein
LFAALKNAIRVLPDLQLEGLFPDGIEGIARGHLRFVLAAIARKTDYLKQI